MKIRSVNRGAATSITWNGKTEVTGIYKYPVKEPIELQSEAVARDVIANRKVHGGVHKACYLFSEEQYPYWKPLYPQLEWNWGMFGENLTVSGMDESEMYIGDIYDIGSARVEVSQAREPCYKMGIRFGTQEILKQFIERGFPGTYVRILKEGFVQTGDTVTLVSRPDNGLTVRECFQLFTAREKSPELLQKAMTTMALPERKREKLARYQ